MHHSLSRAWCVLTLTMLLLAPVLGAQTALTTINDTLYRADGSRFDGNLLIEWKSFQTADLRAVTAYNKSVRVVNGLFSVRLYPTTNATPGTHYQVRYVSGGRVHSLEYWSVPPSNVPLALSAVRIPGPPPIAAPQSSPPADVTIPDVTGLADELAARPKKAVGFTPSHAAVIDSNGDIQSAAGDPSDCIRVDGSASPCVTSSGPEYFDNETPAGLINGSNAAFTLANPPNPTASLQVYRNGLLQNNPADYALSGNTITFVSGAIPQTGDILIASYRLAGSGGQTGGQSGQTGSLTTGSVLNQHVASNAAIQESKLALNFPTHANTNDPTSDQKAALTGTTGAPSNTNRFVTDQDSRLTDARTPAGHPLLGTAHSDTTTGTVARGDLIVGIGTSPTTWSRLPIGAANRCLISNGFDAVWNACLYTGFPAGSVAFVDGTGNLAHNSSRLFWDNSNRRLGVGTSSPSTTLFVHDGSVGSGNTTVTVRAGDTQSSTPLQRWQSAAGSDLARLESDGALQATAVRAASSASAAAWRDTGSSADPSSPATGDAWFHSTENARKTYEAGQVHIQPQIICSKAGSSTSNSVTTSLGKCRIPVAMLRSGDRFDIRAEISHQGTGSAFSVTVTWAGITLCSRSSPGAEAVSSIRLDAMPSGTDLSWGWQNWGDTSTVLGGGGSASSLPAADTDVEVLSQIVFPAGDSVTLKNLTVIRIPALPNQ